MGLLTIIRKQKLRDKNIRVLVLGLDNAGKTTVVKSLIGEDPTKVSPTMGFQIHSFTIDDYTLDIWDVGGQQSLRPFWQNYFDKTDCLCWVLDSSSIDDRLESVQHELESVLNQDTIQGCSLVLIINKVDLAPAMHVHEKLNLEELGLHDIHIVEVCALQDSQKIAETFEWIKNEARKRLGF